jgi:hypothetical protein
MSPEMFRVLVVAIAVWGTLVATKAVRALRSNEPYTFSMWDGGLLRAGKRLTRLGAQIKVAVGVLMAAGAIAQLTGLVPVTTGAYAVMFVALISLISDFVAVERD